METVIILAGALCALLIGTGLTIGSIATSDAAMAWAGYFLYSGVLVLGLFIWSALWKVAPAPTARVTIIAVCIVLTVASVMFSRTWIEAQQVNHLNKLFPAGLKDPFVDRWGSPEDSLKLFMGTSIAWTTVFPRTIVQMRADPMLVIDRDSKGRLSVLLLRIIDESNDVLVRMDQDGFWAAPGVRILRPDKSTLVAFDKKDRQVLYLKYLNEHAMTILGTFRHPQTARVLSILPDRVEVPLDNFVCIDCSFGAAPGKPFITVN